MIFEMEDVLLRTTIAFVLLLLATRFVGKKMIEHMTYVDFVAAITMGSLTGAIVLDHQVTLMNLVLAITSFTGVIYLGSYLSLKSRRVRMFLSGTAIELIRDGKILEGNLGKTHLSIEGLVQQLRVKGTFDIRLVKQAFLESSGRLSVQLIPEAQPLTAGEFARRQADFPRLRRPVELVIDGEVLTENLTQIGQDLSWLLQELAKRNVADSRCVAYMVLNSKGELYIDLYEDGFQADGQQG